MKSFFAFSLVFVAIAFSFVGCTPRQAADEGAAEGIPASETGYTRDSIYEWQDRTFRQLAY
ncbi:MAG: hypothetical protein WD342_11255 [Verrucomicrobiales bacterium]